ncbi:histidine kinase N-terminal domain-containing protein [Paraclostridium ghonii]|uniref:histidine kinase N-terminal domain-containing protein n=1 Tax=Paraclostridium ghonii TaxID=29358 RepID=UPI00202CB47B|nr:histidine kinase N-terminal domain-containing protein [Paeniclostridium ghonii]MCM0166035.1 histidine kinase N-terminal domain-containing protein [Paeniclostridium ghonii]
MIKKICKEYSNLNSEEIDKIIDISKSLDLMANFYESDVFIDVLIKNQAEAIVVAHGKAKNKSIYKQNVVGKKALNVNEPGVINTLLTGNASRDIKALTQEYKLVKQSIQPIELNNKTIAVLIVEKDISKELKNEFETNKKESRALINLIKHNSFITDNLNAAILIFDKYGNLKFKNKNTLKIYESIGINQELEDVKYDDISLDNEKFINIINDDKIEQIKEVRKNECFFEVKTIIRKSEELRVIQIIQDITKLKEKEAELVFKSIAVKETHHRVKNNLQTVISLLRKQSRLTDNEEVKICLDNVTNRVFAILSNHHLLSKQIDNSISITQAVNLLISNIQGGYCDDKNINIYITGEDFKINGDKSSALLLAINEAIQNCYDHAFEGKDSGNIQVLVNEEENKKIIAIVDDGIGFKNDTELKTNLGTFIIDGYIKQVLKGEIEKISSDKGTKIIFKIPK